MMLPSARPPVEDIAVDSMKYSAMSGSSSNSSPSQSATAPTKHSGRSATTVSAQAAQSTASQPASLPPRVADRADGMGMPADGDGGQQAPKRSPRAQRQAGAHKSLSLSSLTVQMPSPSPKTTDSSGSNRRLTVGDAPEPLPLVLIRDPFSQSDLARRLKTFVAATFVFAPTNISPMYAAARGWTFVGQDQLTCELCHASFLLSPMLEVSESADARIVQKYLALLESQHASQCAWRAGPCSESVLDIPLATPSVRAKMLLDRAVVLRDGIKQFRLHDIESTIAGEDVDDLPDSALQLFDGIAPGIVRCAIGNWSLAPAASPPAASASQIVPQSMQDTVLACDLCSRRVGLWACTPDAPHHPIRAHKWYCPYSRTATWSAIHRQLASVSSTPTRRSSTFTCTPVSANAALQERRKDRALVRDIRQLLEKTTAPAKRRYEEEEEKAREWKRRRDGVVGAASETTRASAK